MLQAVPNATEFNILLALAGQDLHGYGIMQEIARQSDAHVRVGPGTLYGAIKRMLEAGWIAERSVRQSDATKDSRRTSMYRITPAGRTAAAEAAGQMAKLVSVAHRVGLLNLNPSR